MQNYSITVTIVDVEGFCPLYKKGDKITFERYYVDSSRSHSLCIHALSSMLTLLSAFIHGVSAIDLGIGKEENIGYVRCPDPGEPYTCGGTVLFKLERISQVR